MAHCGTKSEELLTCLTRPRSSFQMSRSKVQVAKIERADNNINVMKKHMKNKLAMYKSVKVVIASHADAWSELPAFVSAVERFNDRLGKLEQSAYLQDLSIVGVSAVKNAVKTMAVEKTHAMASAMLAYGVVSDNVELISRMKITRSTLLKSSRDRVLVFIDRVLESAAKYLESLSIYGVEQSDVNELRSLRDELNIQLSAPRNAIIDRKGETAKINFLEKELDVIVNLQLDKLVVVLKEGHPDFFVDYKNARMIIDYRNRGAGAAERDDGGSGDADIPNINSDDLNE